MICMFAGAGLTDLVKRLAVTLVPELVDSAQGADANSTVW